MNRNTNHLSRTFGNTRKSLQSDSRLSFAFPHAEKFLSHEIFPELPELVGSPTLHTI